MRDTIPNIDSFTHMNSAAGSLVDQAVLDAMTQHLTLETQMGNTEAMASIAPELSDLYDRLAAVCNVDPSQAMIGISNTAAWQSAFVAIPLSAGDRILVGESEWGGNLSAIAHRCKISGAVMEVVPSTEDGRIDVAALKDMLDERVKVVCVTMVPAVNGLVNPVEEIAEALAGHPAWYLVDAAQAFGNVIADLSNPRFDVVTVSARKYLRGPRGTGFAVMSPRFIEGVDPVGVDQFSGPWGEDGPVLRKDARKFEGGEAPFAVRMGLRKAFELVQARDIDADMARIAALSQQLRAALSAIPGVTVQDRAERLSGIVTFSHDRLAPGEIVAALREHKINIAAPAAPYSPLWFEGGRPLVARVSPHVFNTEDEISRVAEAIAAL